MQYPLYDTKVKDLFRTTWLALVVKTGDNRGNTMFPWLGQVGLGQVRFGEGMCVVRARNEWHATVLNFQRHFPLCFHSENTVRDNPMHQLL